MDFVDSRRWPNEENEASLLRRELITASESPSSINFAIPNSCAKAIALATAMASTMFNEDGRGAHSDSEAIAFPWLSWTTTPRPTLPNSRKTTPSKFSLRQFEGGGLQWAQGWGREAANGWLRDCWLCWKVAKDWVACWMTYSLGKAFKLTRSWLRRCQIVNITIAMSSKFFLFLWSTLFKSLVFEIVYCLRSSKPRTTSHISSSMAHSHNAWIAVSDSTPHCSHLSSNKIFLPSKLCFAGIASLNTHHMKCRTLLGTLSP